MRILAAPHGIALAHVTRPLEIAKVLRKRGHEVIFACSGRYDRFIVEAGFECRPIVTEAPEKALARVRQGKRYSDDERMLKEYVGQETAMIRDVKPDLVLGDFRPTLSVSTEMTEVPYATITNACFTRYYAARHPPPDTMAFTRVLGRRMARLLVPFLQRLMLRRMAAPIRRFRRKQGMRPVRNMFDILESPHLNLIADLPEFGPTSRLPANYRYVGPIMWQPPIAPPAWLDELASCRKTIYLTLGSTGDANGAFEVVMKGLARLDVQVMVTTGSSRPLVGWPKDFHHTQFAPGDLLAAKADLVVCHGGNGTIYQALGEGTPVLCLPTFVEQEYHADRVVALGAGMKLTPYRLSPETVEHACLALISDAQAHRNAGNLASRIRTFDAAGEAAALIESL